MKRLARRLGQALWRWEESLASVAIVVVVGSVAYGVLTRYVTEASATWAGELANLSFTWCVFLGAAAAWRRNAHVSVDALTRLLPERVGGTVRWLTDLLLLAFLAYALYLSFSLMIGAHTRPSPVLRIPFSFVYLAVVLCFASILAQHLFALLARSGVIPATARQSGGGTAL